jgi:hypothetical protein
MKVFPPVIATAQGRLGQFVGANGIRPQWDICTPLSSQEGSMPLTPTSTNDGIVLTDLSVAIHSLWAKPAPRTPNPSQTPNPK